MLQLRHWSEQLAMAFTLLLQSGLGPWGLAALHVATVYNSLPHAALNFQIQYMLQNGSQPDISWFSPVGCAATVHHGKDLVKHHKLAPHGESCVSMGLGLLHCSKAWLTYSSSLNCVFTTMNATFDETYFRACLTDQLVNGNYYSCHPQSSAQTFMPTNWPALWPTPCGHPPTWLLIQKISLHNCQPHPT